MECWKPVRGYENSYAVSSDGKVKRVHGLDSSGHMRNERIRKQAIDKDGYMVVNLCKNGKVKLEKVHRLVANAFIANPQKLPQVNHIDGNKRNNALDNLEWVSAQENVIHAHKIGLTRPARIGYFGEKNPRCKLTDEEVRGMRDLHERYGFTTTELMDMYNASYTHIDNILKYQRRVNASKVVSRRGENG